MHPTRSFKILFKHGDLCPLRAAQTPVDDMMNCMQQMNSRYRNHHSDLGCDQRMHNWGKICNIDKWLKRSKVGRKNRQNDLSCHTGGSMGFDEHLIRLVKDVRAQLEQEREARQNMENRLQQMEIEEEKECAEREKIQK
ncbi:hypothetical protein L1987_68939 [Smallanthus sonchifolius]|uniref:Uncharacterized protein n=1 Tax=Smallanthus sonchifolius TaxID=185202 RepID=A0ACB9B4S8_9ASTR|nr:hypothetical protein L1987_68939 [Smallanthus sonchifolius]